MLVGYEAFEICNIPTLNASTYMAINILNYNLAIISSMGQLKN